MSSANVAELLPLVEKAREQIRNILAQVSTVIVGQNTLIERLLTGILLGGHVLVEGLPGLAKTMAVKSLSDTVSLSFQRIQFTPDLLPADLVGTQIYNPKTQEFSIKKGPLFHHVILADEINRAPAKVQSALLEAMQEKQITIGEETFPLPEPFVVLATQNPIDQEGTYPLPEAQLDRFLFKLRVTYPSAKEEMEILTRFAKPKNFSIHPVITQEGIMALRSVIHAVVMDPRIHEYVVRLVQATRDPGKYKKELATRLRFGASPRAGLALCQAARAQAVIEGRAFVIPQDIKNAAPDVLRHRLLLSFDALADGIETDDVIQDLLTVVPVP